MYQGKKFDSLKEEIRDEDYLGIKKLRFHVKCSHCAADIAFKNDPKNVDYECEFSATRNFERWRENCQEVEKETKEKEEEGVIDMVNTLEHRIIRNKRAMDALDILDEIKALTYRHEKRDMKQGLQLLDRKHDMDGDGSIIPFGGEEKYSEY